MLEMPVPDERVRRYAVAKEAALLAGKLIVSKLDATLAVQPKGFNDIVTAMDIASERLIVNLIHSHFPQDNFFAEEGGSSQHGGNGRWIIDPIDGTENYVRDIPFYAISIAYEQTPGEPEVGVVFSPATGELFSAVKGGGAYLGDKAINVSEVKSPQKAVTLVAPPFRKHSMARDYFDKYDRVFLSTCDVRNTGSAALHLCYVAAGRAEGYFEFDVLPYDIAAGLIILTEAKGVYSAVSPSGHPYMTGDIIASNGHLHSWYEEKLRS